MRAHVESNGINVLTQLELFFKVYIRFESDTCFVSHAVVFRLYV